MTQTEIYRRNWKTSSSPKGSIVLVHGQGEHSGRYDYAARAFGANGYHVFSGDLPGHGQSGGLPGHIDRFKDYLEAVDVWVEDARTAEPSLPLFLLGHSIGGLVVTRYLQTSPDLAAFSGAVLSSPAYRVRYPIPSWKSALGLRLDNVLPRLRMASGLKGQRATRNEEIRRATDADPLMVRVVSVRFYNEMLRAQAAALAEADRITLPLLLLHGGADEIIDPGASLEFGAGLRAADQDVRIVPGLHHEIMNEPERDEVIRDILSWLDGHATPG